MKTFQKGLFLQMALRWAGCSDAVTVACGLFFHLSSWVANASQLDSVSLTVRAHLPGQHGSLSTEGIRKGNDQEQVSKLFRPYLQRDKFSQEYV